MADTDKQLHYTAHAVVSSSLNPAPLGTPVTFSVSIDACTVITVPVCISVPTGGPPSVTLRDGNTVIGTDSYWGPTRFTTTLTGGTHVITANYSGTGVIFSASSPPLRQVVDGPAVYSAPSATGSGTISAEITGGSAGCTFAAARFLPPPPGASPVPPIAPGGVVFPHGLLDFTTTTCAPGGTITLVVTYPSPITEAAYWKYGPTPTNPSPHWYTLPATISGNTATFSITDGGLGDDDRVANGIVVDQGGPGIAVVAIVPALSAAALTALAFVLLVTATWAWARRR